MNPYYNHKFVDKTIIIIIIIIINNNNNCPGYDIKLHPVVEFRRGIMRLPFAAIISRSPLSKV